MAKSVHVQYYTADALIHTGAGRLRGFLISHAESSAQEVIFYNNTTGSGTKLLHVYVAPEQSPCYVLFPETFCPAFTTGLYVDVGACEVCVWSVGFGS